MTRATNQIAEDAAIQDKKPGKAGESQPRGDKGRLTLDRIENKEPDSLFDPVRPHRASDQIFERIRDLIFRGQLMPGQRIPAERQLARQFGVSRPTIREAVHKLLDRGLIEHRRGIGSFVRQIDPDKESSPFFQFLGDPEPSMRDLIEVRLYLECSGIRYAAERATQEDILLLEANLQRMAKLREKGDPGLDEDSRFHMNIAFATHNSVHIHLMRNFHDLLRLLMKELMDKWYALPGYDVLAAEQHTQMLDAIRRRDAASAEKAMHEQISTLLGLL